MSDPSPSIQASQRLYGNANIGSLQLTNLQTAGQLASDQTFMILAIRCFLYFNGTNRRVLYLGTATQLYWTLYVGDKPQLQAPTWYFPAGGGMQKCHLTRLYAGKSEDPQVRDTRHVKSLWCGQSAGKID